MDNAENQHARINYKYAVPLVCCPVTTTCWRCSTSIIYSHSLHSQKRHICSTLLFMNNLGHVT